MLPYDETTFREQIHPFCIHCGGGEIRPGGEPFYGEPSFLVVPMKCTDCGHRFSLNLEVCPNAMVSRPKPIVSPCCNAPTRHTHYAPYGLSDAHMEGSEQHTCTACGREYKSGDWASGLPFFYD
jgi:hypothetical protein